MPPRTLVTVDRDAAVEVAHLARTVERIGVRDPERSGRLRLLLTSLRDALEAGALDADTARERIAAATDVGAGSAQPIDA